MTEYRYPSIEEIHAIELAARHARAREIRHLLGLAARALKSAGRRAIWRLGAKRVGPA
jgi:hypothetical protein